MLEGVAVDVRNLVSRESSAVVYGKDIVSREKVIARSKMARGCRIENGIS